MARVTLWRISDLIIPMRYGNGDVALVAAMRNGFIQMVLGEFNREQLVYGLLLRQVGRFGEHPAKVSNVLKMHKAFHEQISNVRRVRYRTLSHRHMLCGSGDVCSMYPRGLSGVSYIAHIAGNKCPALPGT
jgi:hypothetical protein